LFSAIQMTLYKSPVKPQYFVVQGSPRAVVCASIRLARAIGQFGLAHE